MSTQKSSITDYAHFIILAACLVVSSLGWKDYLPTADRTYQLTWVDYSPINAGNLTIDAGKTPSIEKTLLSALDNPYGG